MRRPRLSTLVLVWLSGPSYLDGVLFSSTDKGGALEILTPTFVSLCLTLYFGAAACFSSLLPSPPPASVQLDVHAVASSIPPMVTIAIVSRCLGLSRGGDDDHD